ncbi:hypothetical protein BV25DRAFT_1819932 [Artomyces pyxidatus]|uniref:Uncharacterized protein n=1 Tax=Artomyces pyxidatus TaxID=48021 RepID=A0ACB8TEI6_9AGAM|nr:hypothetical protein BV25DRAFT_1819932 [Artomyces pyxidatus]
MSNFNPYVQGWAGAAVPRNGAPPSIFGALPTLGAVRADHRAPPLPDSTTFLITHFRPNILNASVVGPPNGQSYFRILTDPAHPTRTSYQDAQRRTFAVVDWTSGRPTVEMPGLFARQSVRSWLQKSSDQSSRHMEVRGIQYRWAPVDAYICVSLLAAALPIIRCLRRHSRSFS